MGFIEKKIVLHKGTRKSKDLELALAHLFPDSSIRMQLMSNSYHLPPPRWPPRWELGLKFRPEGFSAQ